MNATAQSMPIEQKPTGSLYMITVLTVISTVCGLVIVVAYLATERAIRDNLATIAVEAVREAVPGAAKQVVYTLDASGKLVPASSQTDGQPKWYACYDDAGNLLAVACEGSGSGYADLIKLLYAYSPDQECITGFKVLDSKETPGLGDKIGSDADFLRNFTNLDASLTPGGELAHPFEVVKHGTKTQDWQIDAISGATVSSNAVGKILNESASKAIPVIHQNLEQIRSGL